MTAARTSIALSLLVTLRATLALASIGPPGGIVGGFAIDPSNPKTVYATTPDGVYKTLDAGMTWSRSNNGITSPPWSVAVDPRDPRTLYAGAGAGAFGPRELAGMFKSSDAGATWRQINQGLGGFIRADAIAVNPRDSNIVYTTGDGTVNKSIDDGEHWTKTVESDVGIGARVLLIDPDQPDTVYAGTTKNGILRTTDGARTWVHVGPVGIVVRAFAVDPLTHVLYAGTTGNGVLASLDGITWTPSNQSLTNRSVFALAATRDSVYAGTPDGVFKSTNGGADWHLASNGLTSRSASSLAAVPDSATIYAGTQTNVFKSVDSGKTWSELPTGLTESSHQFTFAVGIPPQESTTMYVATLFAGVAKSADGGTTWSYLNVPNISTRGIGIHPLHPEIVYVSGAEGGVGMVKTTDGGKTWLPLGLDGSYVIGVTMDRRDPNTLFAAARGEATYRTIDGGLTWAKVLNVATENVVIDPTDSNIVYAATGHNITDGHGVFKSVDRGITWAPMNVGLTNLDVWALTIDSRDPNTLYAGTIGDGIFKSRDGAKSWFPIGLPGGRISTIVLHPQRAEIIYASDVATGIYESRDAGRTWIQMNNGLTSTLVTKLTMHPNDHNVLYASTEERGLFASEDAGQTWSARPARRQPCDSHVAATARASRCAQH